MKMTPEMKEALLESPSVMELLQSMVDYRKELLLELIQNGEILEYLEKETDRVLDQMENPQIQEQLNNLPPGGDLEIKSMLLTGVDPDTPPSEWTAPEARIVNQWWKKEFPGEDNPLMLYEDELPETLEEREDLQQLIDLL